VAIFHCVDYRLWSIVTTPARAVAKYCDEYVCVCVSVSENISGITRAIFTEFLCMLPMGVARSSSGVVAICYLLPVLWMTSCFSIIELAIRGINFATKDRFRLNVLF